MGVHLNPYLHFDGEAREALAFYAELLGGTVSMMTFAEFGMEGEDAHKIMHGQVECDLGLALMCSDMPPGQKAERGNATTIALSGDDEERLRRLWDGLTAGGAIETPLEKQPWGDVFGLCTDRYGISWMVDIAPPAA